MNLRQEEVLLEGKWEFVDGKMRADAVAKRIRALAKGVLIRMGADASGWDTLYQDPEDKRYWELTYPQSHMHGGGPPRLAVVSYNDAKTKYGVP